LLWVPSGVVNAAENPFGMSELGNGYNVAMSSMPEGSCGSKDGEGKCGEGKAKDGKGDDKAKKDGKCGEGKCGGK